MEEKILKGKKHGMATLLICVAVIILAIIGMITGAGGPSPRRAVFRVARRTFSGVDSACGVKSFKTAGGFGAYPVR